MICTNNVHPYCCSCDKSSYETVNTGASLLNAPKVVTQSAVDGRAYRPVIDNSEFVPAQRAGAVELQRRRVVDVVSCQYGLVCLILLTLVVFKYQINLYIEVTDSELVK